MNTISERALIARINRKIAGQCLKLHKARPNQIEELGQYYEIDLASPNVDSKGNLKARWSSSGINGLEVDIEKYGRELGVLADDEAVAFD